MKWVGRILLGVLLLAVAGGAAGYFYFQAPAPDATLFCRHGAYDLADGRLLIVTQSGADRLRFALMDGDTGRLRRAQQQQSGGETFVAGPGSNGEEPVRTTVDFAPCPQGTLSFAQDGKPAVAGKRRAFETIDTTFESHGLKLFGRLTRPKGDGPFPTAVLVHGSESDSAVLYNRMQYLLAANGVAVFAYDKRGTGKSDGSYTQDFHLLADDAAAAANHVRATFGAKVSELGLQGGSQAGWIEPLAATKTKVDFVLVGYGLAENPLAEDRDEVFDDLRTAGYDEDVIAKAREITDVTGRVMASHFTEGFDQLDAVKAKYGKEPWFKAIKGEFTGDFLAYPSFGLRIAGPFFDLGTSWDYDPVPALRAYDGPHLWILAGRDSSAPSENTLRILREVQSDHPKLDIVVFPNADHGILEFEVKDGERVYTHFSPGYFDLIVDWIKTKKINVPADGAVSYHSAADDTPPSGPSVMDAP